MKRALAVFSVLAVLGFSGFAIGTFSGNWSFTYCPVAQTPSITVNTLTVNYADFGWTFTNAIDLANSGLYTKAAGAFGPFSLTGEMWFSISAGEYMGGRLATSLDFAGVSLGFKVLHWDTDYNANFFTSKSVYPFTRPFREYPILISSPCTQTGAYGMLYILTGKVDPVNMRLSFVDCCSGIQFFDAYLWLDNLGLCCGVALDAELHFTKTGGFDYIYFSGLNIPLCCGVSFDLGIELTPSGKSIYITPEFGGLGEACFEIWGDVLYDGIQTSTGKWVGPDLLWKGIEIYGFKIKCSLGDCSYLEIVEAFDVTWVNTYKLSTTEAFSTACGEYEYVKLGVCGAGCCGGQYTGTFWVYFGSNGGLFDITRIIGSLSIPVMSNFTLNLSGTFAVSGCAQTSFCFGWTFSF
jgi:hypothetical protein